MDYLRRIGVLAYIIASCTASTIYPSRFIVRNMSGDAARVEWKTRVNL
jgi:hypothetical protein